MCFALSVSAMMACSASASMRISEWMYSGLSGAGAGEFIEFTNFGHTTIDMTGWSYDDDSRIAGSVDLSAFGMVDPGESVILAEMSAGLFNAEWSLGGAVTIIGGNIVNLGRNDEINLFNAGGGLVDRLTYGDQNILGTIRTQNISGNPRTFAAIGANDVSQWVLSAVGDRYGSVPSFTDPGDVANPGTNVVPEPASILLLLGTALGVFLVRKRG
jgi:hypothetical protein